MDFWKLKILDEETARAFIEDEHGCVTSIRNVTSITLEAAKLLVEEFDNDLYLCSITSLTEEIATVLAKHPSNYEFLLNENFEWTADLAKIFINGYGIPSSADRDPLSDEEAAQPGAPLGIDCISGRNHCPEVLQEFSKCDLTLYIKIDTPSKEQAEALINHTEGLRICSLTELSPDVAASLAEHKREELHLIGDFEITEEAANAFSGFGQDEWLVLRPGKLSEAAARKLSQIKCSLSMAIKAVDQTPETIAALAMSGGNGTSLEINNLSLLTESIAEALATYKGDSLNLNQEELLKWSPVPGVPGERGSTEIKEICEASAKAFAKFKGKRLDLPIEHISAKVAQELSQFEGQLGLTGLHELSDGAAESFANGKSSVKLYYEYYAPPTSGVPMKISDHARELLGKNPNNSLPPLPDDDDEDYDDEDYDDEDYDYEDYVDEDYDFDD